MTDAAGLPVSYRGEAFNQVPDSDNRIHSDEVARQFGFEGALVPGVTVSSYLTHPAVVAWGERWLDRGHAHITVKKPLYDRRRFSVAVTAATARTYHADLTDDQGTASATAEVSIPDSLPPPPVRRGDPPVGDVKVPPTREGLEDLRRRGMGAMRAVWADSAPMATYFRDPASMPAILRMGDGGLANTAFLLGLTNWHVAANVALGPWLHLETTSQHHARVPAGSELVVEGRVADLFERKGHEFVDVDVGIFLADDSPAISVRLRAIYRLRG
jgi:hypothetical protein